MWPTDETGARDKAVFLTHVPDFNNEADFAVNMLIAYGIPAFKTYNNEGSLGKLIIGTSAYGAALYVPASMAADAKALLESSADAEAEQKALSKQIRLPERTAAMAPVLSGEGAVRACVWTFRTGLGRT